MTDEKKPEPTTEGEWSDYFETLPLEEVARQAALLKMQLLALREAHKKCGEGRY